MDNTALLAAVHSAVSNIVILASSRRGAIRKCAAHGVACACLVGIGHGQRTNLVESIESAKKTVAPIVCMVRDGNTGKEPIRFHIMGTGFMADSNGTFITAYHVIADFLNTEPWKSACSPAISFPVGGWKRDPAADIRWFAFLSSGCQVNLAWDIAICQTLLNLAKEPTIHYELPSLSDKKPPDGAQIFFTGFPLQATDPITSVGSVAGFQAEGGYATILIDKNAWPGASGSPIFADDGKTVVGMILRTGTGDAAGLSFGVSGDKIVQVLAEAQKHWAAQRAEKNSDSNAPKK